MVGYRSQIPVCDLWGLPDWSDLYRSAHYAYRNTVVVGLLEHQSRTQSSRGCECHNLKLSIVKLEESWSHMMFLNGESDPSPLSWLLGIPIMKAIHVTHTGGSLPNCSSILADCPCISLRFLQITYGLYILHFEELISTSSHRRHIRMAKARYSTKIPCAGNMRATMLKMLYNCLGGIK